MIGFTVFCLILLQAVAENPNDYRDYLPSSPQFPSHSSPANKLDISELPSNFWWGNVNGTNYLTIQRNTRIPAFCTCSWAFASTSALNDRIKIIRKAQWPDILLSPQVLISCCDTNSGCGGGSAKNAYLWIKQNNITDETCSPYQGIGYDGGLGCSSLIKCMNCENNPKKCDVQLRPKIYGVNEFGSLEGEADMMNQIYARGPITCTIAVTGEMFNYTSGIFEDKTGKVSLDHQVSVTGWGEENGVKYWIARNSWGSYWGEGGNIKVIRGINNIGIEKTCSWATPIDTWTKDIRNETKPKELPILPKLSKQRQTCKRDSSRGVSEHVVSPRPHEYLSVKDLPQNFDWRNVSGVNYLSWTKNQWAPQNCGGCWAEATTSCLADRINIARNRTWPDLTIALQVVINCNFGGNCNGGNPSHVYRFALQRGIPQESCQAFTAKNPASFECSDINVCKNCNKDGCFAQKHYVVWKASEHGLVEGAERMKAQIFARGPISCGIDATDKWEAYTGGIFSESKLILNMNHEIAVVGWGKENGVEYWIGRNSYGTSWGDNGYFRIQMHRNNLGIQLECSWAAVEKEPHVVDIEQQLKI